MRTPNDIRASTPRDADGIALPFEGESEEQIVEQIAVFFGVDVEEARHMYAIGTGQSSGDIIV
jgi:hypothetical protein